MPVSIHSYIYNDNIKDLEQLIVSSRTCLELREAGNTPLMVACLFFKLEAVKILLKAGANIYAISSWRRNALHDVISNLVITPEAERDKIEKLWAIVKLLLEREVQLISEGCIPAVRLLESKTDMGRTPLDMATSKPEIQTRLLRLIGEVADKFEKRDASQLFSEPTVNPVTEKVDRGFSRFFHRSKHPLVKSEEEIALVYREPITVSGNKPKVD